MMFILGVAALVVLFHVLVAALYLFADTFRAYR